MWTAVDVSRCVANQLLAARHPRILTELDQISNSAHYEETNADSLRDLDELSAISYDQLACAYLKILFIVVVPVADRDARPICSVFNSLRRSTYALCIC